MAVVNNNMASIIGHGAGNITLGGSGGAGSWTTSITGIQAESLVEPLVQLEQYYEARNFKGWGECYEYFNSIAKLNNLFVSELMSADIKQWKASKCK